MDFISPDYKQYRANLHSHTNLSDGKIGLEESIAAYKDHGFQILAVTDHERPQDLTHLSTEDFLLLTGYEAHIRTNGRKLERLEPEIHINLFAKDPHNVTFISRDPNFLIRFPRDEAEKLPNAGPAVPRVYTREYIQEFINAARENGYLVSYNHPLWSMESAEEIAALDGIFSLEVMNSCGLRGCYTNFYNMGIYDEMLRKGKRWFCHGGDDNHGSAPEPEQLSDSFGTYTMILARELSYPAVIEALETGRFYPTTGPIIHSLEISHRKAKLRFSDAQRVIMHISPRYTENVTYPDGSSFCEAEFTVPKDAPYVYFTIHGKNNTYAMTRAFFAEEFD